MSPETEAQTALPTVALLPPDVPHSPVNHRGLPIPQLMQKTPAPSPVENRVRRAHRTWSPTAFLGVMVLAALIGRGVHQLASSRSQSAVTFKGSGLVGSPPTTDVEIPVADSSSTENAEGAEKKAFSAWTSNPYTSPIFTNINPAKLHRAQVSYVPFPKYAPSTQKLRLQNTQPLLPQTKTQAQLSESYWRWKWRQGEEASQVERFIDLYSPDAQIFLAPGKQISVDQLRQIIVQMRLSGFFTSVTDQKPPTWMQNAQGDEAEVLAYHLYMDDSHNLLWGQRRLLWHKQGDKWLIVRDEFPPCYFSK